MFGCEIWKANDIEVDIQCVANAGFFGGEGGTLCFAEQIKNSNKRCDTCLLLGDWGSWYLEEKQICKLYTKLLRTWNSTL